MPAFSGDECGRHLESASKGLAGNRQPLAVYADECRQKTGELNTLFFLLFISRVGDDSLFVCAVVDVVRILDIFLVFHDFS